MSLAARPWREERGGEEGEDSGSDSGSDALLSSSPLKRLTAPSPLKAALHPKTRPPGRAPPPPLPPTMKYNLLHKLHFRQLRGRIKSSRISPEMKLFSRLPGRLAFFIRDAVPGSALAQGHIFLGFSKCGQYLLSYTQTTTEGDQFDLNFNYYYRLHWWVFLPYTKARKVAEVTLFANQGVYGNLHITFCQWPRDHTRVVVFGYQTQEGEGDSEEGTAPQAQHCFLTVTAVPSLGNCHECVKVANSYDADDVAAAWNSCVRLSCLAHGMTVHTQFDLVAPYPKFEPKISLKRDNCVVVNTGNFLHSITVELEQLGGARGLEEEEEEDLPSSVRMSWLHPLSPPAPLHPIAVNVGTAEFNLNSMLGSPGAFSPASFLHTSDSDLTDAESEASQPQRRRAAVSDFSERLGLARYTSPSKKACPSGSSSTDTDSFSPFEFALPTVSDRKRSAADAAYDLTDDNFASDSDMPEKLSTFRKKRLADKKYEFTEEVEAKDKFVPLTRLRSKKLAEAEAAGTQQAISEAMGGSGQNVMVCVSERSEGGREEEQELAREEDSAWADMLEGTDYPELFSPGGCIKKDSNALSPRVSQGPAMSPRGPAVAQEIFCRAKFVRRFVEVDDELISIITDVEDDDLGTTTGYHNALPLEVHGSGYTQMAMISNSKAERLALPCVRVQQRSLDLEQFCHETATRLCAWADKKFWFCNDYDVEVVDVDPFSGDVTAVAVVLIQAAILTKSQGQKFNVSSLSRKQYQATFKFCWNVDSGHYYVVDSDSLKEITAFKDTSAVWNPARSAALPLLKMFQPACTSIRALTNESVIRGVSLKAIIDPDNLVALIMNDLE